MKILIAEADTKHREALTVRLKKAITRAGDITPEIHCTASLRDALVKSAKWQPNITFLNPVLTDANWEQSLHAIKNGFDDQPAFFPPVFVVTCLEKTPELIGACLKAGAIDVYYKPWEMDAVEKIVSDVAGTLIKQRLHQAESPPNGS